MAQVGSDVSDFGRTAANTFGLGDRALAGIKTYGPMDYLNPGFTGTAAAQSQPSPDYDAALKSARADTDAASQRIGPVASAVANTAGYAPMGAFGIAGKLGGKIIGSAAEGAVAGGAAAAGHDDSVAGGMVTGGGTGAGIGLAGRIINPIARAGANAYGRITGALSSPEDITAATKAASTQAYNDAKKITFNPNDVNPAYTTAASSLDADQARALSPGFAKKVADHIDENNKMTSINASNIDGFARDLQNSATTPADGVLANRIASNLDNVMELARPTSGHKIGDGLAAITAARQAHGQSANAEMLQGITQPDFQTNPSSQVARTAKQFYQPGSPQWEALSKIYNAAGGGGQTSYKEMNLKYPDLGYMGASVGGGPGAMAGEIAGHALKPTVGNALGYLQRQRVQEQVNKAYPVLTGGKTSYSPDVGGALRALMLGNQAANGD